MAKLRIVYMGTPEFAVPCLERLVADGYDIAAVVTQPDRPKGRGQKLTPSPVKEAALKLGLTVLQPEKIKTAAFMEEMAAIRPDLIVVVAFGQFLPKQLLELPPLGCINVHASLLPKYRGAAPLHWVVINGEKVTGVTTMYMDVGMDTGDMILKAEIAIGPDDTTGDIHDRLKLLGAEVLSQTVSLLVQGKAPREQQKASEATYAPLITRELERINWHNSAEAIHNLVRGLAPWPGSYTRHRGKILKIWRTKKYNGKFTAAPGQIAALTEHGFVVGTGQGLIEVCEVQPESKRRMPASQYVHGYSVTPSETLE